MEAIKARLFPGEAAPAKIGRFTVLRQIGAGGMSVVYAAYDERLDRRIAVKLLRSGESTDNQARLLREAQAMARLSHPNVVAVHEVGAWEQQVYVAMEFVRGPNLREWLQAVPRDIREIREVFVAAGRGLAAAHHAGLVHRDFKPANVLVGDDGRVRVGDFGLVRHAGDEPLDGPAPAPVLAASLVQAGAPVELSTTLTQTGAILGTPAYMSPEQHLGRPVDARSDQFSFCVALYEALYGAPPFAGRDLFELVRRVLAGAVSPVPEDSKVPAWLRRAILRGLAVDPAARWPGMDDLLDELERDPERAWRIRRGAALVGVAVVGVVVGLIAVARERADAAAQAQRAEAAAERQRRTAEDERAAAEQERDRAFIDAKAQLAEAQRAQAALKDALAAAEAQRLNAEAHAALAEHALSEAERRRREAEGQRKEAERQTGRAVHEAARARDANRLAQALAGARGDPTTVLALLREVEDPAAASGWVPAAVWALQQPVSAAVLRGRGAALLTAAFSPDGARVAAAGEDRQVTLWSWPDDHVLKIHEHQGPVRAVAFAPAGELVSGAENGAAVWRDPPVRLPAGAGDDLRAFALAPDGRTLVTGGGDGRVRAWDLDAAPPRPRELARHEGPVHAVLFDRTGHLVASAGADGAARIVDLRGGPPRSLPHPSGAVRSAAFSPDGRKLATGAQDGLVRVWDALGSGAPALLRGHADEVVALAWSPDGDRLASASLDRSARLWSSGGALQRTLRGHDGRVYAVAWSPGGDRLVTASQDGTARVWPVGGGAVPGDMPLILRGHGEAVVAAGFSPAGDHVVTASRDGTARVWRVRGGDPLVRAVPLGGPVDHLLWTAAGLHAVRADGRALRLALAALAAAGMASAPGLKSHAHEDMSSSTPSPSLFLGAGPNGHVLTVTREGALQGWDEARRPLPPRPLDPGAAAAAVSADRARGPGGARRRAPDRPGRRDSSPPDRPPRQRHRPRLLARRPAARHRRRRPDRPALPHRRSVRHRARARAALGQRHRAGVRARRPAARHRLVGPSGPDLVARGRGPEDPRGAQRPGARPRLAPRRGRAGDRQRRRDRARVAARRPRRARGADRPSGPRARAGLVARRSTPRLGRRRRPAAPVDRRLRPRDLEGPPARRLAGVLRRASAASSSANLRRSPRPTRPRARASANQSSDFIEPGRPKRGAVVGNASSMAAREPVARSTRRVRPGTRSRRDRPIPQTRTRGRGRASDRDPPETPTREAPPEQEPLASSTGTPMAWNASANPSSDASGPGVLEPRAMPRRGAAVVTIVALALTGTPAPARAQQPGPVAPVAVQQPGPVAPVAESVRVVEPAPVPAQEPPPPAVYDTVILRDGSVLRGTILELHQDREVIIQLTGGARTIPWADIASTTFAGATTIGPEGQVPQPSGHVPTDSIAAVAEDEVPPGPSRPRIYIELTRPGDVHLLEAVAPIGAANPQAARAGLAGARSVCRAPCGKVIDGRAGFPFYFGGDRMMPSQTFFLKDLEGEYVARVRPGRRGLLIGGMLLAGYGAGATLGGTMLTAIGRDEKRTVGSVVLGVGLAMLIGGIVMAVRGSTRYRLERRR
nr:protein kinase [Nannocystis pusilla]